MENWFGACCCSFGSKAEVLSARFEKSLNLSPGKCLVGSSTFYVDLSDAIVDLDSLMTSASIYGGQYSTLSFLALGNGFMVWENEMSKCSDWKPVHCTSCASLIGVYPCKKAGSGSIVEGLHLFRCQITTFNADGSLCDAYRYATFEELLVKELRSRTEENTSYRFLIRSLSSKLPLLQLVVLSYECLICTGRIIAPCALETADDFNIEKHPLNFSRTTEVSGEVGGNCVLQPSIRVMFLDCSSFSANDIRSTELWVQEHDAETVYMLDKVAEKLKRELLANSLFFPAACGLSQLLQGSFLYTKI